MIIVNETYGAGDYEALTIDNTAGGVGFTAGKLLSTQHGVARGVFCTLESGQIRFTLDGTAPTTLIGHLLEIGQSLTLENVGDLKNFKAIRTGAVSGSLKVTYRY